MGIKQERLKSDAIQGASEFAPEPYRAYGEQQILASNTEVRRFQAL
jgi:hypothetical protein